MYINLDVKDATPGKLCKLVKKCEMEDQVMIYTGSSVSTATEYQYTNVNIAVHPYISKASDTGGFSALPGAKLFQYGYDLYAGKNTEIGREVRALGYLSYSNLLQYDGQVANKNYKMLDAFIAAESDFVQTDFAELVDEYLKTKGLKNTSGIQEVEGIFIYPSEYFCPINVVTDKLHVTENTRSIHHYAATWQTKKFKFKKFITLILESRQV